MGRFSFKLMETPQSQSVKHRQTLHSLTSKGKSEWQNAKQPRTRKDHKQIKQNLCPNNGGLWLYQGAGKKGKSGTGRVGNRESIQWRVLESLALQRSYLVESNEWVWLMYRGEEVQVVETDCSWAEQTACDWLRDEWVSMLPSEWDGETGSDQNATVGLLVLGLPVGLWHTSWMEFALDLNRAFPAGGSRPARTWLQTNKQDAHGNQTDKQSVQLPNVWKETFKVRVFVSWDAKSDFSKNPQKATWIFSLNVVCVSGRFYVLTC